MADTVETDSSPRGRWSASSTWVGDGIRREVFFFRAGDTELYGSLFAATTLSCPLGVVACGSWGVEADRTDPLLRSVVLGMARLGGCGLVFHYPGYGDSFGNLADARLSDLSDAAITAVAEASRRRPGVEWMLAGFMVGASVAALAERDIRLGRLLLVQPSLRPGEYFRQLEGRREPLAPGSSPRQMMVAESGPGIVYGYPVPRRIGAAAEESDRATAAALAAFDGSGAIIRHEKPPSADPGSLPPSLEQIEVPGTWRFGALDSPRLSAAALDWLERTEPDAKP